MFQRPKRRLPWVMLGLSMALIILLVATKSQSEEFNWVQQTFQEIVLPLHMVVSATTSEIGSWWGNYVYLVGTQQENFELKIQISQLKEELNQYAYRAMQFERLRKQLDFEPIEDIPTVFAEVIGASSDSIHQVLLINKGSTDNIRRNQAVVLKEGVVGRIQTVSLHQSLVHLITDFRHRFPVTVQSPPNLTDIADTIQSPNTHPQPGMAVGTSGGIEVRRIPMLADIRGGDLVITNGLAGLFPKGLMIGTVKRIRRKDHELHQVAEIVPTVDFLRIEGVYVLLRELQHDLLPVPTIE